MVVFFLFGFFFLRWGCASGYTILCRDEKNCNDKNTTGLHVYTNNLNVPRKRDATIKNAASSPSWVWIHGVYRPAAGQFLFFPFAHKTSSRTLTTGYDVCVISQLVIQSVAFVFAYASVCAFGGINLFIEQTHSYLNSFLGTKCILKL